jgi:hypothetical protein
MGLIARPIRPAHPGATSAVVDESILAAFGADVSLISDDGLPAEQLLAAALAERPNTPEQQQLLPDVFARMRAIYDAGEMIPHPASVLALISKSAAEHSIELSPEQARPMLSFFDHVNRVLFQHQALSWIVACEMKIRLYGTGWEMNPAFARLAMGPIEDDRTRALVWRATRINLALGPYGVASERVLDGIAGGGFFLMRFCPADVIERFFPPIAAFCKTNGIATNADLKERASIGIRRLLTFASRTLGMNVIVDWPDFVPHVLEVISSGKCRSAAALWSSYPAVSFHSRDELLARCERFHYDGPARQRLADEMRRELAEASRRIRVSVNRNVTSELAVA